MRLLRVCIAFAAGIHYPTMAAELNLDGFQETRWGMTEAQVQEIYHGKLERWTKAFPGVGDVLPPKSFLLFGMQHYDIDQCDFSLDFDFKDKRLSKATLGLNDMTRLDCTRKIVDILVRKYGAPRIDEPSTAPYSESHLRTWFVGNTMIREVNLFYPHTRKNQLFIYYEPTQTSGAKKL